MPHKNDWMISGGWWITAQVVWCIDFIWFYCPSLWFVMMTWNHLPFVVCHCHDFYISFESYRQPPIRIELWNPTMMVWGGCSFIQVPIRFHVCFYDPPPAHSQLSWSVRHHYLFPYSSINPFRLQQKKQRTCLDLPQNHPVGEASKEWRKHLHYWKMYILDQLDCQVPQNWPIKSSRDGPPSVISVQPRIWFI